MDTVDRVAFAIPLRADGVSEVEELARAVTADPGTVDLSRQLGLQRSMAWIQLDESPILTVYMEWRIDPVGGLEDYEVSQEAMAQQIQTVLRQSAASPGDAALDETASRSKVIFEWGCEDKSRGKDLHCYARVISAEKAAAKTEFLRDLEDPLLRKLYSRLRERVGMNCITLWEETLPSGEAMLIELYESDDLDRAFDQLAKSAYDLDEITLTRTAITFGWTPGNMPELREIYNFAQVDGV